MQIDAKILTMGERRALRQLLRAKAGKVTVREAREFVAPTGRAFVIQVAGVTVLAIGLGIVFLPFLLGALAPIVMPLRQRSRRTRWLTLLPVEHDAEPFTLT